MNMDTIRDLIVGLLIGGLIYWLASLVPPTMQKFVQFIGGLIIILVVVNFIFALLGMAPLIRIAR